MKITIYFALLFLQWWANNFKNPTLYCMALAALSLIELTADLLHAQNPSIRFEHLSIEHGLSQSSVMCILQDRKGYMWFGTLNGLNKYDGYTFTDFRHNPNDSTSLSNDQITAIFEDSQNQLWVGTQGGLNCFDPRTLSFTRFMHDSHDPKSLSHDHITSITEDRSGVIWVGTVNGLSRLDRQSKTFSHFKWNPNSPVGLSHNVISAIHEDARGHLWLGTNGGGLSKLNVDRTQVTHYLRRDHNRTQTYVPEVFTQVKSLLASTAPLCAILRVGDSQDLTKSFRLQHQTDVLVIAGGEATDQVHDQGWIEQDGKTIWKMAVGESRYAGGAGKNRIQMEILELPAGEYSLRYQSDGSHAFGRWNRLPPSEPDYWGMQAMVITPEQKHWFEEQLNHWQRVDMISSNHISTIFEDDAGQLWVGTNGGGLNRFDPKHEQFESFRQFDDQAPARYTPAAFHLMDSLNQSNRMLARIAKVRDSQDLSKTFAVRQSTQVAIVAMGETSESESFDYGWLEHRGKKIWQMEVHKTLHAGGDVKNRIQIATATLPAGHYTLRYRSDDSHAFGKWNEDPPHQPELWGIQVMEIDQEATDALSVALESTMGRTSLAGNFVRGIAKDQSGTLWVATSKGLSRLDASLGSFSNYRHNPSDLTSLSANDLQSIYVDKTGVIWLGTILGGINKINSNKNHFKRFTNNPFTENSLNNRIVYSFLEDQTGLIWIGTWSGLSLFKPGTQEFQPLQGSYSNLNTIQHSVMSLHQDRHDQIWVGTDGGGLFRFDRATGAMSHYRAEDGHQEGLRSNVIYSIYEDSDGRLWFGTYGDGLYKLNSTKDSQGHPTFVRYSYQPRNPRGISHSAIRTIYEDAAGLLWLGTNGGGLNRFDKRNETFIHYRHNSQDPNSLSHDTVTSIYEDDHPYLWVATYGGGLNRFDRDSGTFHRFTDSDGLPNNVIYGILPDQAGNLWLSSNMGLSKLSPGSGVFTNYDLDNGLQSNEFNTGAYLQLRNGEMVFGGINGFNIFQPEEIRENSHVPEIVITNFKKFNETIWFDKPISEARSIDLSYRDNFISFEFAALDYTNPKKNQYAYKLEGFDRGWVQCGNRRFASYTNLDPGDYTFWVRGSNNDGVWNEEGASVKLRVVPPWWQTWWAKAMLTGSLFSLLFLGYRFRIRGLEAQQRRLEGLVKERTRELQTQKEVAERAKTTIEQQANELKKMDRVKSRFFTNISHEFRTPLTLILGPLEQMLSNGYDRKTKRMFSTMRSNAHRLLRLINQLLDLSRLDSDKMQLQPSFIDLTAFVASIVSSFISLAESKGIRLRLTMDEIIEGNFDPDKVEKVLYNLLSNAIKHTPDGGSVAVQLSRLHNGGQRGASQTSRPMAADISGRIEISVTDTGVGIPQDQLPFIFDRFYQANGSSTRDYEGSGIGLALTKELVELHGGQIVVTSAVGKGTEFRVTLPLATARKNGGPGHHNLKVTPTIGAPDIVGADTSAGELIFSELDDEVQEDAPIILIVEDHIEVQNYIREHLASHYQLITALNGAEGFEKAMKLIPDLVISDVMMPEMDGYELCRNLKTDEKTSHIPIILLTAKAALEDKLEGLGIGADDYLTKPFDLKELQARVSNLIEQRRKLREQFTKRFLFQSQNIDAENLDEALLKRAFAVVEKNLENPAFGAEALSQQLGLSTRQLQRKIRALTNYSPIQFIRLLRLKRAKLLLEKRCGNIAQVAFEVGFNNLSYFSKCFREEFGVLPSDVSHVE